MAAILTIEPRADESSSQSIFNMASLSKTDDSGQLLPGNPRTQKTGDLTGLHSNAVGKQSTSDPAQQTSGNPVNANETQKLCHRPGPFPPRPLQQSRVMSSIHRLFSVHVKK